MSGNRCCLVVTVALLWLWPMASLAQQQSEADRLFEEGRVLLAEKRFAEACEKFMASNEVEPSSGALLNLAKCRELNQQPATAVSVYRRAIERARGEARQDRIDYAKSQITALGPQLSYLVIDVPDSARQQELEVRRDGVVIAAAQWGQGIALDPGRYVVTAQAPGAKRFETEVVIGAAGSTERIVIPALEKMESAEEPAPLIVENSEPSEASEPGRRVPAWLPWVALGTSATAFALGGAFYRSAASKYDDYDQQIDMRCEPTGCVPDDVADLNGQLDSARSQESAMTAAVIAGSVLLATSGVLLYLSVTEERSLTAERPRVAGGNEELRRDVFIAPTLGRGRVGVAASVSF